MLKKIFLVLNYVNVCVWVCMCALGRSRSQIPWSWSCRELWATWHGCWWHNSSPLLSLQSCRLHVHEENIAYKLPTKTKNVFGLGWLSVTMLVWPSGQVQIQIYFVQLSFEYLNYACHAPIILLWTRNDLLGIVKTYLLKDIINKMFSSTPESTNTYLK